MTEVLTWIVDILTKIIQPFSQVLGSKGPLINQGLGNLIGALIIVLVILTDLINSFTWLKREGVSRGIFFSILTLLVEALAVTIFWYVPHWIYLYLTSKISPEFMRWVFLYAVSIVYYLYSREFSGARGFVTYLAHLTALLLGWLFGGWLGIIFLSMPLILAFYFALKYLALAIVPAANPDDRFLDFNELVGFFGQVYLLLARIFKSDERTLLQHFRDTVTKFTDSIHRIGGEKWKRFLVLVWYMWGVQYPHLVVTDTIGRRIETRIRGSQFNSAGAPGMIWCKSNQLIGITTGPHFARVGGPGLVFTHMMERPIQIADPHAGPSSPELDAVGCVDLRIQLRTAKIAAVTKDGNPFEAILFTSFAIDRLDWTLADHHRLNKANPILRNGRNVDHGVGNFKYNPARVQAALSTTSINNSIPGAGIQIIHWDDWVVSRLSEATRQVLSQRNLDELWHPRGDGAGKNALDEIGGEIKAIMEPRLQEYGIRLFASRVVNYIFPENHPIVQQQIATWSAAWEKRSAQTLAEGQAEADRLEREATAYARSMFLTLVADGLDKARLVNPELPKHVIAMRVIGAMEELLKQPAEPTGEAANEDARQEARGRLTALKQKIFPQP